MLEPFVYAGILEIRYDLLGGFQSRIGYRDTTDITSGNHHVIIQRTGILLLVGDGLSPACKQFLGGKRNVGIADIRFNAVSREFVKIADNFKLILAVRGVCQSFRDRLLGVIYSMRSKGQESVCVQNIGLYCEQLRGLLRKNAGFVDNKRSDTGKLFDGGGFSEQRAEARSGKDLR